jgi:ABC-type phosphate/phosphonate transport system substrate-binding protein
MSGHASLPMYDLPSLHTQNDAFWFKIREAAAASGSSLPEALYRKGADAGCCGSRSRTELDQAAADSVWSDPELLFSQICGSPLSLDQAHEHLAPLASPIYDVPGLEGASYHGVVVVHQHSGYKELLDLRGGRLAINDRGSYSGCIGLQAAVSRELIQVAVEHYPPHTDSIFQPPPSSETAVGQAKCCQHVNFFANGVVTTGSHHRSAEAVSNGDVDAACLDVITFNLLRDANDPAVSDLRVIATTPTAPSPPFVVPATIAPALRQNIYSALVTTISNDPTARPLRLKGIQKVAMEKYREFFRSIKAEAEWIHIDDVPLTAECRLGTNHGEEKGTEHGLARFLLALDRCGYTFNLNPDGEEASRERGEVATPRDVDPSQCWIDRGMLLLWGFMHHEALACFRSAVAIPGSTHNAMGYWGVAQSLCPNYNKSTMSIEEVHSNKPTTSNLVGY